MAKTAGVRGRCVLLMSGRYIRYGYIVNGYLRLAGGKDGGDAGPDVDLPGLGFREREFAVADFDRHPEGARVPEGAGRPAISDVDDGGGFGAGDFDHHAGLRVEGVGVGRGDVLHLGPRAAEAGGGGVDVGVWTPSGHVRSDDVVEVVVVHDGSALKRRFDEAHLFFDVHVVVGEFGDEESFGGTRFEDEVRGAVVVDELADVAAFLIEWAEAFDVGVTAVDFLAGGDGDTG